jgi:nitrite reductase (NADH) small subunit/3-phenylpropionate/trans-cinnamate dioxygenase ferredoxin subunit
MADYQAVARVADIPPGTAKTLTVANKLIAIFHQGDQFFALDDVCLHMGGSLGEGEVHDGIVTCPWHGWRFRMADGAWADSPKVKTGCYPVRVTGDNVEVLIEDQRKPPLTPDKS